MKEKVLPIPRNLPSVNPQKWIPVSERLPEFGKNVLTQGEDGYMRVDWYSSDNIWFWAEDDAYQPIAWMPLPEPYKGEQPKIIKCPNCGNVQFADKEWCPDCGARMFDLQESEDKE